MSFSCMHCFYFKFWLNKVLQSAWYNSHHMAPLMVTSKSNKVYLGLELNLVIKSGYIKTCRNNNIGLLYKHCIAIQNPMIFTQDTKDTVSKNSFLVSAKALCACAGEKLRTKSFI